MKKTVLTIMLAVVVALALTACGNNNNNADSGNGNEASVVLKIGASAVPHAEILQSVAPKLEEQGIKLDIIEFNDYVQPNVQVYEKKLDANFFQHQPYLDQFNQDKNYDLVSVADVHIEPFGAYSNKIKSADELKDGAKIAIPNDPSNGGRALSLLEANGIIKLKDGVGVAGTVGDIVDNPKKVEIVELEAATLPRVLDEVDLALINTNYALQAGLAPTKDALFIEGTDTPYVNVLTARSDNKDSDAIQKLAAALTSPEVKKFIEEKYTDVIPAF